MRWCIATCDKLSWIMTSFEFLMDKYCPEVTDIDVLGYSNFPKLSDKYNIVSLAKRQEDINDWGRNLHEYLKKLDDEFIIFGLEDLLPKRPINYEIFNAGLELLQRDKLNVRYELGIGHCWHGRTEFVVANGGFNIYKYGYESLYRISTQWAIWRRSYLLHYLNQFGSPWQFEVEGSRVAASDGYNVFASLDNTAWDWVHSALSGKYPNMVNVLGIERETVEEMISRGLLDRSKLQLGIELNSPKYE